MKTLKKQLLDVFLQIFVPPWPACLNTDDRIVDEKRGIGLHLGLPSYLLGPEDKHR